jgi:hypothetical protein
MEAYRRRLIVGALLLVAGCKEGAPALIDAGQDPDEALIRDAFHTCFSLDCDIAHQKLSQVAAGSPARQSDGFHAVEFKWGTLQFLRAAAEPDPARARQEFRALAEAATLDGDLRAAVAERLQRLEPTPRAAPDAGRSTLDLATSGNPADVQRARDILEPKVFSGRGTESDVMLLRAVCEQQSDRTCLDACNKRLGL